jgi:hypothetical protein
MNALVRELVKLAKEKCFSPYPWYSRKTECYAIAKDDRKFVELASPDNIAVLAEENAWLRAHLTAKLTRNIVNITEAREVLRNQDVTDLDRALEAVAIVLRVNAIADDRLMKIAADVEKVAYDMSEEKRRG